VSISPARQYRGRKTLRLPLNQVQYPRDASHVAQAQVAGTQDKGGRRVKNRQLFCLAPKGSCASSWAGIRDFWASARPKVADTPATFYWLILKFLCVKMRTIPFDRANNYFYLSGLTPG